MKATTLIITLLGVALSSELKNPSFLVDLTDIEKTSCYFYTDLTFFNLLSLYKEEGYTSNGYKFNFCKTLDVANKTNSSQTLSSFAYKVSTN